MDAKNQIAQFLFRAVALFQAANFDEAEDLCHTILGVDRQNIDALSLLGTISFQRGDFEKGIRLIKNSLEINGQQPQALGNLGSALQQLKWYDLALQAYEKAIRLKPDYFEAYKNQGIALYRVGRYQNALDSYEKAIHLNPYYAEAYAKKGITLYTMKRHTEAVVSYKKAIQLKPDYAEALNNLGNALYETNAYDEALACYEKALLLEPHIPYLTGLLLHTKMHLSDWHNIDVLFDQVTQAIEEGKPAITPFAFLVTPASPAQQKKCAEISVRNYPPAAKKLWNGEHYKHDRIRIGYFSADYHNHAVMQLMARVFETHDRSRFEVTAFSFGPAVNDAMQLRLKKAFEHFLDVSEKSDIEIAMLAKNREIDIAIDLMGFTHNCRTGIFAQRLAPVQVNYLGHPGTMGTSFMDYLIADRILIPEENKSYYTEKIVYMPDSYQANDSSRKISDKKFTRREMGLPEDGFVFCCFNNSYKITPDLFDIWMRLLHKVPSSVLWLFEANSSCVKNLRKEALSRGIAEERLIFANLMELNDHIARQQLADLFLDTFYYNAHATASHALWAGLPVLTCLGKTFASRVGASLLHAVGLPEMITYSHGEYEALALQLATDPEKLSAIHKKLAENKMTYPFFNTELFTKHIENAYTKMWEISQAGSASQDIYVHAGA